MDHFLADVIRGLQSFPKYLNSKYFYDKKGDTLFQKIMASKEYYLTNCEKEIFSKQTAAIAEAVVNETDQLNIIEFGPGDATKSTYLLKELTRRKTISTYFPIDISEHIIHLLSKSLPKKLPYLSIHGLHGEYFEMLSETNKISTKRKLVLFLGANIGNFKMNEMPSFCNKLRASLSPGDMTLIGFDLKKNPRKILAAYNDGGGLTRKFNLNLLKRINKELSANFKLKNFEHYATYGPDDGACKSYLVSLKPQKVSIGEAVVIHFDKDETIFMEISQKYLESQISEIAQESGFVPLASFFDKKKYFVDVLWKCDELF